MNYGFVIDNSSCIGCHACSTACKSENEVPLGVYRTWVKSVEVGVFPDVRRSFQVTRCNHCDNAPCVRICPTAAMHRRPDGIVDFASDACIGCKGCIQACPYDSIHIDPTDHTAAKCNFCAHRIDVGLEPACVVVCPEHAIIAGDLDDPSSEITRVLGRSAVTVRKPEQGTMPTVFYIEGQEVSLDPTRAPADPGLAAAQRRSHPAPAIREAARIIRVSYDVEHERYWHWPIPAYLVTKHVAGGAFLYLAVLALIGGFAPQAMVYGGGFALVCLALTLGLLVYDLDRPDRFLYLFFRPQWRSWIARAAWLLSGFAFLATGWWALETAVWFGWVPTSLLVVRPVLAVLAAPLGLLVAIYTAFLFAQAEGRDLWQSPHLPALLTGQALMLGAAPFAAMGDGTASAVFGVAALACLAVTLTADLRNLHATQVAKLAAVEMTHGAYRSRWVAGLVLGYVVPVVLLAVGLAPLAGASAAIGLYLYSYALVMAAQTIRNS